MKHRTNIPALGPVANDRVASGLRALVSAVPLIGGALVEIVTEIVPSQRIERIEAYLKMLAEELSAIEAAREPPQSSDLLVSKMRAPENVDLVEEGARLASRALSQDRLRYITKCIVKGLADEERTKLHHKRVLAIIEALDDEEILILDAYASSDHSKFDRVRPPPAHMSASSIVLERNALYDASVSKLERVGLIKFKQKFKEVSLPQAVGKRVEKLRIADVDSFGRAAGYRDITSLGRHVLRCIGLADESPFTDEGSDESDDD